MPARDCVGAARCPYGAECFAEASRVRAREADIVVQNFRPFFQTVRAPIDGTLTWVEGLLTGVPTLAMVALLGLLAWQFAGRAVALGAVASLLVVAMLGMIHAMGGGGRAWLTAGRKEKPGAGRASDYLLR